MEIKRRPHRAIAKAIRVIESCNKFEQLGMAYCYGINAQKLYSPNYELLIWKTYENKYNELKPKEDNNESNS